MNTEYSLIATTIISLYLVINKWLKHNNQLIFKLALSAIGVGVFLTEFQYTDKNISVFLLVGCFGFAFIDNYLKLVKKLPKA